MYKCLQERAWWSPYARQTSGMLWVAETKRAQAKLPDTWSWVRRDYTCIEDVEALYYAQEVCVYEWSQWFAAYIFPTKHER